METTTARGAASGAVGVVAMDVATWLLYRRESRLDLLREKRLRPYGKDSAHDRGMVGHVVLGMVTEATLNAVDGDVRSR
jgi:hypothetical protein